MIKMNERTAVPDTYLSTPVFGNNQLIDLEMMKVRYKERLRNDRRKTLKILRQIPQSEILVQKENNIKKEIEKKRSVEVNNDYDYSSQELFSSPMIRRITYSTMTRVTVGINFGGNEKNKETITTTNNNNQSPSLIINTKNRLSYTLKKDQFFKLSKVLTKDDCLIESFCTFCIDKETNIKVTKENAKLLLNLWQELYISSLISDVDHKQITFIEIHKHYFQDEDDLNKIKDLKSIFKERNLIEISNNIKESIKDKRRICTENFNALRHDIENEIMGLVFDFDNEKKIDTSLDSVKDFTEQKKYDLKEIIQQVHKNDSFASTYLDSFIIFHLKWMTSVSLLTSLFDIYNNAEQYNNPACIKSSVIFFIDRWIFICPQYWKSEILLQNKLLNFTNDKNLKVYWDSLLHKLIQKNNSRSISKVLVKKKSWDIKMAEFKLFNYSPEKISDIAEQLTLMNAEDFVSIDPIEFARWNTDSKEKLKNISKYVKNMNTFSEKIIQSISSKTHTKEKLKCIEFYVLLAQKLLQMGNFNAFFCLQGSLSTFEKIIPNLSPKIQEIIKEFYVIMSPQNNFKMYREKLKYMFNEGKPLIPVLPIHLKDVYYVFEQVDSNFSDDFLIESNIFNSLKDFTSLTTTLQKRWLENKMNYLPNLSVLLELKFGFSSF